MFEATIMDVESYVSLDFFASNITTMTALAMTTPWVLGRSVVCGIGKRISFHNCYSHGSFGEYGEDSYLVNFYRVQGCHCYVDEEGFCRSFQGS
jgi:hypothetical protein